MKPWSSLTDGGLYELMNKAPLFMTTLISRVSMPPLSSRNVLPMLSNVANRDGRFLTNINQYNIYISYYNCADFSDFITKCTIISSSRWTIEHRTLNRASPRSCTLAAASMWQYAGGGHFEFLNNNFTFCFYIFSLNHYSTCFVNPFYSLKQTNS